MMHFLRLIRYKNLLMIIATQFIIRYALFEPLLRHKYSAVGIGLELQLPFLQFVFLVLATVLICASGYIINDYFDVNADMINKPDKVVIGKHISRRVAIALHWVFNIVGIILGGIVSYSIGYINFTAIFVLIITLLWLYSTTFSKQPFVGNIVVALLVAMVPIIVAIYELIPLDAIYHRVLSSMYLSFERMLFWSLGYAFFAFLLSLLREMIKDVEDLLGDKAYGRNTIPISLGIPVAKVIISAVYVISVGALIIVYFVYLRGWYSGLYIFSAIVLPLLVSGILFIRAQSSREYGIVSTMLKIIMIMGMLYIPFFNFFLL
ncbi:MAG: geranylgeranylglycerol-phosphate geranylgeranyltransferase [Bacteroidales bacterium]|jgi:4-hydroxybenzoate polyprenyltransferase|nr:geranylgeranylglycerol-phosphate geranylgeranyltransferase [Bacteroidales bacterium]